MQRGKAEKPSLADQLDALEAGLNKLAEAKRKLSGTRLENVQACLHAILSTVDAEIKASEAELQVGADAEALQAETARLAAARKADGDPETAKAAAARKAAHEKYETEQAARINAAKATPSDPTPATPPAQP
jgi:DNA-binding ferritin-like protein